MADVARRLLLRALDALLDLPDVIQILGEPHAIARAEIPLQRLDVAAHRVQDALVAAHPRDAFGDGPGPAEQPLEHHARVASPSAAASSAPSRRSCSCRRSCSRRRRRRCSRPDPRWKSRATGTPCRGRSVRAITWSSEMPARKSSASVRFGEEPVSQVAVLTACVPPAGRSSPETTTSESRNDSSGFRIGENSKPATGRLRRPEAGPLAHRDEDRTEAQRRVGRRLRHARSPRAPSRRGTAARAWHPCRAERRGATTKSW